MIAEVDPETAGDGVYYSCAYSYREDKTESVGLCYYCFLGQKRGASLDSDRNQEECFRLCCQATGDVLPVVHLALQDSQVYHLEELQVVVHRRHPPHPTHHLHHPLRLQRACTYSLLQQQAYALPHYAVHPGT